MNHALTVGAGNFMFTSFGGSQTYTLNNDATIANSGRLFVGDAVNPLDLAIGKSLYVRSGGQLDIINGQVSNTNAYLGHDAGSTGHASVQGVGSSWTSSGDLYVGGSDILAGGTGGLVVSSGGLLDVAGTLRVWGTGVLNFTGGTIAADTFVPEGSFSWFGGTLQVSGVQGDMLNDRGTLAPGASAALLTIDGDYAQETPGALEIEIGGESRGDDYDALIVTGDLTPGGTLQVVLIDEFAPEAGDTFDILDWGALGGTTFDAIELPELLGRLTWDLSNLYANGRIGVIEMLVGDTDVDWDVDAADYGALIGTFGGGPDRWTDFNEDGVTDIADFAILRAQFGEGVSPSGSLGDVPIAIPEPASVGFLLVGLGAVIRRRYRK